MDKETEDWYKHHMGMHLDNKDDWYYTTTIWAIVGFTAITITLIICLTYYYSPTFAVDKNGTYHALCKEYSFR